MTEKHNSPHTRLMEESADRIARAEADGWKFIGPVTCVETLNDGRHRIILEGSKNGVSGEIPDDGTARIIHGPKDAGPGEIVAYCWKCHEFIAFGRCYTRTRILAYGGKTIIFQPNRYYAACPECGAVQLEPLADHPSE